ncbi:MAG: hypothetical protein AAF943_13210 [Pseudomonadota bacterium]
MFELFFTLLAAAMNAAPADDRLSDYGADVAPPAVITLAPPAAPAAPSEMPQAVPLAPQPAVPDAPVDLPQIAAPTAPNATFNMAVVPQGLTPDPQVPSGQFTTAAEVKPILSATKGNWVVLRAYEDKDWLYITHLWSWRCGLKAIAVSLNDEPMQNWPIPPCYEGTPTPNAIRPEDGLPYLTLRLNGVQTITLQIVYDDLSMDVARFSRAEVLIP